MKAKYYGIVNKFRKKVDKKKQGTYCKKLIGRITCMIWFTRDAILIKLVCNDMTIISSSAIYDATALVFL